MYNKSIHKTLWNVNHKENNCLNYTEGMSIKLTNCHTDYTLKIHDSFIYI